MATPKTLSYIHGQCAVHAFSPCTSPRVYLTQDRSGEASLTLCYYHLKIYRGLTVPSQPVVIAGKTYKPR